LQITQSVLLDCLGGTGLPTFPLRPAKKAKTQR